MTYNNFLFPFNKCNDNELNIINNSERYIPKETVVSNLPNLPNFTMTDQLLELPT